MYPIIRSPFKTADIKRYIGIYREYRDTWGLGFRVHVPNHEVLGFWVKVIEIQVLGKYMIIRYLDT